MSLVRSNAVLMISVSGEAVGTSAGVTVKTLAERLAREGLQATWGVASPADWPHAASIAACRPRQELALWSTATAAAARLRFGDELRRAMLRARAKGLDISTMMAADTQPADHADLLANHGITALCPLGVSEAARAAGQQRRWLLPLAPRSSDTPQKLRWGLWQMPAAVSLTAASARQVRRAIDRTVATTTLMHMHIDLASLGAADSRSQATIDAVLSQIATYCRDGRLRTQTVSATAAALTRPRPTVPACSILRKRAA